MLKADVIACDNSLIGDLGEAMINLGLMGVLCILGSQYMFR